MINLNLVKAVYNKIPNKALSFLEFLPFSVFCGNSYRQQLREIQQREQLSEYEIQEIRDKRLLQYLNDSIVYTKFYSDFAKSRGMKKIESVDELALFPIICKEQLQSDKDWFLDSRYLKSRFKVTTGGTTGRQTELYLSNDCYSREWAFVNSYLIQNGIHPDAKRLCLRGVQGDGSGRLISNNYLYKELIVSPFCLSEHMVLQEIDQMIKYGAQFIHGYPSSVKELALILKKHKLTIDSIKALLLVSERMYSEQLEVISSVFDAKVLSFYGMTERLIFAPLRNGSFFPDPYYGVVEQIDNELIGTGFINQATRLIRFRTGDSAVVKTKDSFVSEILSIEGRWGREYLVGRSGVKITMTSLNIHSDELSRVQRYQFFQEKQGICEMRLMVAENFTNADMNNVIKAFQHKVGNELNISGKIVSDIPLTSRGKHTFIKSTVMA